MIFGANEWEESCVDITLENTLSSSNLHGQKWENRLRSLFPKVEVGIGCTTHNINTPINEALNEKVNMDELKAVKNKIAVGPDSILNF